MLCVKELLHYVIFYIGFCCATEDASPMMILEFMQFGDLQSFLVHNKPRSKSTGLTLSTFYSIAADVSIIIEIVSDSYILCCSIF